MIPEAVAISSVFTKNSKFDLLEFGQECKWIALLKHNFIFNQSRCLWNSYMPSLNQGEDVFVEMCRSKILWLG